MCAYDIYIIYIIFLSIYVQVDSQYRQCIMGIEHKYIRMWNNIVYILDTYIFSSLLTFPFCTLTGISEMKLSEFSAPLIY